MTNSFNQLRKLLSNNEVAARYEIDAVPLTDKPEWGGPGKHHFGGASSTVKVNKSADRLVYRGSQLE